MNVFELRNDLVSYYREYISSFINIRDTRIRERVDQEIQDGLLWPDPLIQLNPAFEPGDWIEDLVKREVLHPECAKVFQRNKDPDDPAKPGKPLHLHRHQSEAVLTASGGHNYVLTTGTGSGKSLAYIIPIVDHVLRTGSGEGIKAIVVYPMNALANSQEGELRKFLCHGYPDGRGPVTFARYTGQESEEQKQQIIANPPDIILTNYVMLELILTRPREKPLIRGAKALRFLVLDELHTYRGRQGADVAMLVRRTRNAFGAENLQCVGTSATLAGPGSRDEQRAEVAQVASRIFGSTVQPDHITGETLQRSTPEKDSGDPEFRAALTRRVGDAGHEATRTASEFLADPLSSWIETVFGLVREEDSGRLARRLPRCIVGEDGAANQLSALTGVPLDRCAEAIEEHLLASYQCDPGNDSDSPPFAFRLHQFISRGDTVYASVERGPERYVTVRGQQYVPGDRDRVLLPLAFCRECGQEYYVVRKMKAHTSDDTSYVPRELRDQAADGDNVSGFLYTSDETPWPDDELEVMERLPDDWLEEHKGRQRIRPTRKKNLPASVFVDTEGTEAETGLRCQYIDAPFRFCLSCGVSYGFRMRSDFTKLASLATEGRSTATTILSLAAIRYLRADEGLEPRARKLLSFTDNRQDASLQAGHFNDFVEIGVLRSGLLKAISAAGPEGVTHESLAQKVSDALDLPVQYYANDPDVRFQALEDTKRAFRAVLAYRLYRDLKRGWRVTAPNLEQCGLLEIRYPSLDDLSAAEDVWSQSHPAVSGASPETRCAVARTLLDFMRRELAVRVDCLDQDAQERIKMQSDQRLRPPWAIDENERMEHSAVLYPRSQRRGKDGKKDYGGDVFLSPRGAFGQYLRRNTTFPDYSDKLSLQETEDIARQLLVALKVAGLVEVVREPREDDDVHGYRVPASALVWVVGDGKTAYHDPIRVPRASESGGRTNPFFVDFYKTIGDDAVGLEAREHTAQVKYEDRIDREHSFRRGSLPVLFCSPTMELGVDIAELNTVNMRNVPPTPANYAQRSGRAGRSGQPALVFTYCSTFSQHDQYFFRQPELMVGGVVSPPRLDLTNEDLVRAHIQAVWLSEAGMALGSSLKDILDLDGDEPSLELLPSTRADVDGGGHREKALARARAILRTLSEDLAEADWYTEGWPDEVMKQVGLQFDAACERWRGLYRAATQQRSKQHGIILDHSRPARDKDRAKRLRAEAEAQIELLTEAQSAIQSDFYSYRYFASEGFLPGYNFPRLPLSAFIPGRRKRRGRNDFVSRPRFLAISEFGPRSVIYHEGAQYKINRVIMPLDEQGDDDDVVTTSIKQCNTCGYLHVAEGGNGPDLCERCGLALGASMHRLFRLQNVSTKRVDKINSDEEERIRLGYELRTGVRFATSNGRPVSRAAQVLADGKLLAKLSYGHAANVWRINLGWRRRKNRDQYGFVLDIERGYWASNQQDPLDDDQDPMSDRKRRVIPYVEDHKNCLLLEPTEKLDPGVMASLQAALKNAIQVEYQLEDRELATEPLPSRDERNLILLYESAEGGAGVLRRLVDDPRSIALVADRALRLCHYEPETGKDLMKAPGAQEDCEAACYDCLMSYTNQQDHLDLDRSDIRDILMALREATVEVSPASLPRAAHLDALRRQCQSGLEREWLGFLEDRALNLPSAAQKLIPECSTRPDFAYESANTVIYVDGPQHDYPERQERDKTQAESLEDLGYLILRFGLKEDWQVVINRHPNIFGSSE